MFAQESLMDIKKEREVFEAWFESRYDAHFMQFALDLDLYVDKHTQTCWEAWQAARVESHKQAALYQFEINHLAQANQQWREKAAKAQAVLKSPVMAFDEWFKKRHEKTGLYEEALCGKDDATYIKHEMNKAFQAGRKEKQAVPEGFVLVPKENISCYWQDNDEPENFCSNESDFDCLGDCIDLGEIMEINKFTQAHVNKEILFGTWFAEAIDPSEKANFFVGTHAECLEIVAKNKAVIEAQEPAND